MLLVHIIYYTYNATLVKSVYSYVQVLSLTNKLHITTRLYIQVCLLTYSDT